MANMVLTMGKALLKHKLHLGTLTGMERFMVSAVTLADRPATFLAATNIEPDLIDPKFDYELLSKSVDANLELFGLVRQRIHADVVAVPYWLGLMCVGPAEFGTVFKIEKRRVPYPVEYPIKKQEDIAKIKIPQQATGYLKMVFDINKEAQRRYPDAIVLVMMDGPWDLAMLLRGDRELPTDLRIYKDYTEAKDQATPGQDQALREPGHLSGYHGTDHATVHPVLPTGERERVVSDGLRIGRSVRLQADHEPRRLFQVCAPLPCSRVWEALGKKVSPGYHVPSPQETEQNMQDPVLSKGFGAFSNYIFPQTPEGLTLPEYDRPMLELAKKYKQSYMYMVHGKYLRDASEAQLDATVQRICRMAAEARVNLMVTIASVPPGASVEKANYVFQLVEKYGRY